MSLLDWQSFNSLPGDKATNFENLCRGLIRLHFGSKGEFTVRRNQPGVEFHLKLTKPCKPLGIPPRWYGWQCKTHTLTTTGNLTSASKRDIKESLETSQRNIPDLTDWVLWTPYTLSKNDQTWFNKLKTNYTLHQWTDDDVDCYLAGPALFLRHTYFGQLITYPDELALRHRESAQVIGDRWLHTIHQPIDAERTIRRMLGEPGSWEQLTVIGSRLKNTTDKMRCTLPNLDLELSERVTLFSTVCSDFADTLLNFHHTLAEGDIDVIRQFLGKRNTIIDTETRTVPISLRRVNHPISLDATNALDDMRLGREMLKEVDEYLGVGLVAVIADAGAGKTQLAAQLTAPQDIRPAGVLLHGRVLHRGQTLDNLASRFLVAGKPATSMEELLAVIDAAGKRAGCRLPLVIDGLNEAENPKDWKAPLASLRETVKRFPNVLVVCTLRTGEHPREFNERITPRSDSRESFAIMSLPESIRKIESSGFGSDTEEAIKKYFKYFKIELGSAQLPTWFLQHPLTLRIFCEVTNPKRENLKRIEYFPASLSALFDKYIQKTCERISHMTNLTHSYTKENVSHAIHNLGLKMWEQGNREIDEREFRSVNLDINRDWESSIVNLLMQEGIVFRNPSNIPYEYVITPTYDALGGFIIASALLKQNTSVSMLASWLNDDLTIASLTGENSHAIASDILMSLVTLTPQYFNGAHIWKIGPQILRDRTLRFSMYLEPRYLDKETINTFRGILSDNPRKESRLFSWLATIRDSTHNPFNAEFLDSVLRTLGIADRDLSWSEWIRKSSTDVYVELQKFETIWKDNHASREGSHLDKLRAIWVMWLLTSTDRELRDVATRALYWYGRGDPCNLFHLTIGSLEINDPYVPERMLAASYGVVMSVYGCPAESKSKNNTTSKFARLLFESLFDENAPFNTTHCLLREYASGTVELVALIDPGVFSEEELEKSKHFHSEGGQYESSEPISSKAELHGRETPLRMDFENYVLGRLVRDRSNYDYEHEEYRQVRARVLRRVAQLGWEYSLFNEIDENIARSEWQYYPKSKNKRRGLTERYGKKYSWIAYFEIAGLQSDLGRISRIDEGGERTWDVNIDPSFPAHSTETRVVNIDFLGSPSIETRNWIAFGQEPDFKSYLKMHELLFENGPWVMLDCYGTQHDEDRGRMVYYSVQSFLVKRNHVSSFKTYFNLKNPGDWRLPPRPSVINTFAGEIPWYTNFPENKIDQMESWVDDLDSEVVDVRSNCFEILIPVCDYAWESGRSEVNDVSHATTLAKEVSLSLQLFSRPQTFDLYTKEGIRATRSVVDQHDRDFNQSSCFIREELLNTYMKKYDYTLVWVVSGDRSYSARMLDKMRTSSSDHPELRFRHFGQVILYESISVS